MTDSTGLDNVAFVPTMPDGVFEAFFTLSLDLCCIAGTDGYFKHVNPAFSELLGFSERELLSQPFTDFILPEDLAPTIAEVEKLADGRPTVDFVNRYKTREGDIVWLSWKAAPRPDGSLYAIARDITDDQEQRRLLDRQTEIRRAYSDALERLNQLLTARHVDFGAVVDDHLRSAMAIFGCDGAVYAELESPFAHVRASCGETHGMAVGSQHGPGSFLGTICASGRVHAEHDAVRARLDVDERVEIGSFIAAPVILDRKLHGVIVGVDTNRRDEAFDPWVRDLSAAMAAAIGRAYERHSGLEALAAKQQEIEAHARVDRTTSCFEAATR